MILAANLLEEVLAHARSGSPREVCGWLVGEGGKVCEVRPVPNAAEEPKARFEMEPEAQLRVMREVYERGLNLLGTYHSHPKTPPLPSARDLRLALYPKCRHLIVSLAAPEPEVLLWRITEEGYERARLQIPPEAEE